MVAKNWEKNPEVIKETIKLMVQKGARLKQDGQDDIGLPSDVRSFIKECMPNETDVPD